MCAHTRSTRRDRVAQNLAFDQILTAFPDVDEPFKNKRDVVHRLLPYHIYQHPQRDLDELRSSKGKEKVTELVSLKEEIEGKLFILLKSSATRLVCSGSKRSILAATFQHPHYPSANADTFFIRNKVCD